MLECLQALANSGITQAQQAVRNVGAVPYLIQLMTHENPRISQTAAALVSSLCPGDMRNAEQLFESGGLVMLAEHLDSGEERAQLQARLLTRAQPAPLLASNCPPCSLRSSCVFFPTLRCVCARLSQLSRSFRVTRSKRRQLLTMVALPLCSNYLSTRIKSSNHTPRLHLEICVI